MILILRLVLVISAVSYRIFLSKFFKNRGREEKNFDDVKFFLKKSTAKDGTVYETQLIFEIANLPIFRLMREGFWAKTLKKFGFAEELQTGNKNFDAHFYVMSDHRGFLRFLKQDPELIATIYQIARDDGWEDIRSDGDGHIVFRKRGDSSIELLKRVRPIYEKFAEARFTKEFDFYFWRFVAFEILCLAISAYAAGAYVALQFDPSTTTLNPWRLVMIGFAAGVILYAFLIGLLIYLLKGSSRAPILLVDFGLILLISILIAGPQMMLDVNQNLDRSPPAFTDGVIKDSYSKTTGSGKSRRTTHYVVTEFRQNPYQLPSTQSVPAWDFYKFSKGQGIRFVVREGYFKSPYIEDRQIIERPDWELAADSDIPNRAAIDEAVKWRAPKLQEEVTSEAPRIEKWPNRRMKSKEPQKSGKNHGLAEYRYPNGQLYAWIPWFNGQKHGEFSLLREDQTVEAKLNYKNGKLHGLMTWYDSKGDVSQRAVYIEGQHIPLLQKDLEKLVGW